MRDKSVQWAPDPRPGPLPTADKVSNSRQASAHFAAGRKDTQYISRPRTHARAATRPSGVVQMFPIHLDDAGFGWRTAARGVSSLLVHFAWRAAAASMQTLSFAAT